MEHTTDELDLIDWVVAGTSGEAKFLGRVVCTSKDTATVVREALNTRGVLTLHPVFEFFSPMQRDGDGLHRSPLVVPVDFVMSGVPVHIVPVFVYLCADMQETDRNEYKGFVERAVALANGTSKNRKGESSGGTTH